MYLLNISSFFLARFHRHNSMNLVLVLAVIGIVILGKIGQYCSWWIQALAAGLHISFSELIGMSLRHVNPGVIINSKLLAYKANIDIPINTLEAHYLAKGNVQNVVRALIKAKEANLPLTFQDIAEIDLSGHDAFRTIIDIIQENNNNNF